MYSVVSIQDNDVDMDRNYSVLQLEGDPRISPPSAPAGGGYRWSPGPNSTRTVRSTSATDTSRKSTKVPSWTPAAEASGPQRKRELPEEHPAGGRSRDNSQSRVPKKRRKLTGGGTIRRGNTRRRQDLSDSGSVVESWHGFTPATARQELPASQSDANMDQVPTPQSRRAQKTRSPIAGSRDDGIASMRDDMMLNRRTAINPALRRTRHVGNSSPPAADPNRATSAELMEGEHELVRLKAMPS